jgi:hypothetical protein
VYEDPEGIIGIIAYQNKVTYHKIDTLGVAHLGKVIGYTFEHSSE